jgi:hypothetical protein
MVRKDYKRVGSPANSTIQESASVDRSQGCTLLNPRVGVGLGVVALQMLGKKGLRTALSRDDSPGGVG